MLQSIGAQLKPEIKDNLAMSYMILQKHHCVLSYTKTTIDAIKHTFFFSFLQPTPFRQQGIPGVTNKLELSSSSPLAPPLDPDICVATSPTYVQIFRHRDLNPGRSGESRVS
jgi:hypothetical protein